ncbi:uncharacterized protein HMPREF1541_04804 [Cyphellophora europaea CBS 101466]|uniref:SRR1-like domain-containing protein n=1 Tax=Cyphellophora europaea (strain CBS 101466) TaxID=1220924 RepID=W2RVQ7_CYPE1|nr:uncharacterized protein HMPREF1541_04804 [Cyphellophora europaea CBS 101466]ETN40527.1 hypothetical protein HMPREF1541_04804 [Cyphellophora europaea CBS 101466]
MPHTSRRKKQNDRVKRTEVVGNDGWTRITTTAQLKAQQGPPHTTVQTHSAAEGTLNEPFKDIDFDLQSERTYPSADVSIDTIMKKFDKAKNQWLASPSCAALQTAIGEHLDRSRTVDNCTIFGSGSYCGLRQGWIERFEVALVQTAIFLSVVDTIGKARSSSNSIKKADSITERLQESRPRCFAQEPTYNSLDHDFLSRLGISAVQHPIAFEQLPSRSFAYTPGAEQDVELRVLYRNPDLLLTNEIDLYYRNAGGVAFPKHTVVQIDGSMYSYEELHNMRQPAEDSHTTEHAASRRKEHENNARVCERFSNEHHTVRLPDLDMANYPFHQQFLHYRPADRVEKSPPRSSADLCPGYVNDV